MAARRHWRFVVRDQYGFVIQNAQVFVYQPGTTTVFTGTAYDAASGGAAVTNPFITNAFGEVEAWFDTAQVVDVLVTDNSNLAYRAVGGVADTANFPSFTEKDDIYVSASDQVSTDFGEVGDITSIDPGDAALAGATGEYADAGHQHENTGVPNTHTDAQHSDAVHGVAQHTDVARQLFLPAAIGTPQVGALASIGTYPNIIRVATLADAVSTNGEFWDFQVPDNWASGALTISPIWIPGATDGVAHTVRWECTTKLIVAGTDVTAAASTVTFTGDSATRTVNLAVIETPVSTTVTPIAAGNLVRFALTRLGADAADSYVGVVNLAGVIVAYTANQ